MIKINIETRKPSDYLNRRFRHHSDNIWWTIYSTDSKCIYYKADEYRDSHSNYCSFTQFLRSIQSKTWVLEDDKD